MHHVNGRIGHLGQRKYDRLAHISKCNDPFPVCDQFLLLPVHFLQSIVQAPLLLRPLIGLHMEPCCEVDLGLLLVTRINGRVLSANATTLAAT